MPRKTHVLHRGHDFSRRKRFRIGRALAPELLLSFRMQSFFRTCSAPEMRLSFSVPSFSVSDLEWPSRLATALCAYSGSPSAKRHAFNSRWCIQRRRLPSCIETHVPVL